MLLKLLYTLNNAFMWVYRDISHCKQRHWLTSVSLYRLRGFAFFNLENFHRHQFTSHKEQRETLPDYPTVLFKERQQIDRHTQTQSCWYSRWLVFWLTQDEQRWTKAVRTTWDIYEKFPRRSSRSRSDQERCLWTTSRAQTPALFTNPCSLRTMFRLSCSGFRSLLWSFVEMCSSALVFTRRKHWRQRLTISLWVWLWQICCWQFWCYHCSSMQR